MNRRRPESLHERLMRAFRLGSLSAFDFGSSSLDEVLEQLAPRRRRRRARYTNGFERDAANLAEDARKVMGDLVAAERKVLRGQAGSDDSDE